MTRPRVLVIATLQQTTSPGAGSRGSYRNDSHDHIPGSVLRGACAAVWIRRNGIPTADDPSFLEIFEGNGTFGPLQADSAVRVPLSVRVHKYGPGPECSRLWWDRARGETATRCGTCGQDLVDSKGERTAAVPRATRVHSALDIDGVALDKKLFETTGLIPGTRLSGWVTGPAVAALYDGSTALPRLKFGGGRSTGGAAAITLDTDASPDPLETHEGTVILRLAAPGVFFDDFGFPADRPSPAQLRDAFGCDAEITGAWTRWTRAGGWHAASGLPKPTERAVAAGSTYTVRPLGTPDPKALDQLRTAGIGARRREGFGALYTVPASIIADDAVAGREQAVVRNSESARPESERKGSEHDASEPCEPERPDAARPEPERSEPEPPSSLDDHAARARPITDFDGWPKLAGHLRRRSAHWPPDAAADARLVTAVGKVATREQADALAALLAHRDRDRYLAVLDAIEAR